MPRKAKRTDPDYRERDRWIVANMAGVWPRALPECVAALKRRDERERKRGIAEASVHLRGIGEWYKNHVPRRPLSWVGLLQSAGIIGAKAGPAALAWARRQKK